MKTLKKALSLTLAIALSLAMAVPAMALATIDVDGAGSAVITLPSGSTGPKTVSVRTSEDKVTERKMYTLPADTKKLTVETNRIVDYRLYPVWLEDGDRLDEYGVPARVLALPGHTAGSIGLDLPEGRPLGGAGPDWAGGQTLVGDALMNMGRPGLSLLYEDREALAESGRVIAGLGERRIWFGHGGPVGNRVW